MTALRTSKCHVYKHVTAGMCTYVNHILYYLRHCSVWDSNLHQNARRLGSCGNFAAHQFSHLKSFKCS